ncbi:hypothetical protein K402DRAFT_312008, partial [Aulographum hederae CBS 113979]
LLLNIDGPAGSGKSYLIHVISAWFKHKQDEYGVTTPALRRIAPTGVAAFGIRGRTLHSLLRLPI